MSSSGRDDWPVTRLSGALGAQVRNVDLRATTPADIAAIRALLLEHLVLAFPAQQLSVEQHVALAAQFGPLEGHPHLKNPQTQHPHLFELVASKGGVADEWHTDITFRESPALMSVLHMVKCPDVGGDTMWTNLYRAYEELSAPMQALCDGLTALHDALPHNRPDQMAIHPVVRVHPDTQRKALYVNEHFTRVQRATVMGDKPVGAQPPRWQPWVRAGRASATSRHDRQLAHFFKAADDAQFDANTQLDAN